MTPLTHARVTTILPVKDMDRARKFYEGKLGMEPEGFAPDGNYMFACGQGDHLSLIPKPEGTKAEHTAVSFEVDHIEDVVAKLERDGIAFEDYDLPTLKTVNHICAMGQGKAAWFKDTEGNYLCLHEMLH
jgi:catechol 2,3-dioxygenase-like lactoylglutathione lyase family enzyme